MACVALLAVLPASGAIAETSQLGNLRVTFAGEIEPSTLPRDGQAPVGVSFSGRISTADRTRPPQLRRITIAINRQGRLHPAGLPACRYRDIQPASSAAALASCRRSLVGKGHFGAAVSLPEQSPFPSSGRLLAFNGTLGGRPVLFAHVYGTRPLPQSNVLVFEIGRGSGRYGTMLTSRLPRVGADWGFVRELSLKLRRSFAVKGRERSYLSAGCPAPDGVAGGVYPFAKATFSFADGRDLEATLTRTCRVSR
jgi:hypothetical protein